MYSPEEYSSKAEKMNEPKEAVLFIIKKNANVGHFVGVFTDDQNRIHYGDSFGSMNEIAINPSNRKLIVAHNAVKILQQVTVDIWHCCMPSLITS